MFLVKRAEEVAISALIEHGADVLQPDAKGEGVIYLAQKLSEANSEKYGTIYRTIHHHLRPRCFQVVDTPQQK